MDKLFILVPVFEAGLCEEKAWHVLETMFNGFDPLQNDTCQSSLYDIFRCDDKDSKTIVQQLTGFMVNRTAKPLGKKIVGSNIQDELTNTRSIDYLYLVLSMICIPVVVECNHNAGKRTPQLQKFATLSPKTFEMVKLHNDSLKRKSTMKVWNLKREFHKWAFDVKRKKKKNRRKSNSWAI